MLHWLQRFLFVGGFAIIGYCAADWFNARMQQAKGNRELDRVLLDHRPEQKPNIETGKKIPEGGLVGKVEIPKLHLSAVVFQGTNDNVLDRGVGHMDSSALPGQNGNIVLAAHRDTFFRSLRDIRQGDEVKITTKDGPRSYRVESTEIVPPTDIAVAQPTRDATLTLITCYPFYYVGHAPKRFIVRAKEIENPAIEVKNFNAPQLLVSQKRPVRIRPAKKERARFARPFEVAPSPYTSEGAYERRPPENSAGLNYTVRVSQ